MIFFTDENISPSIARMLDIFDLENEIRAHADYFDPATPDTEWLLAVAQWDEKPAILCGDGKILKNKVERQVLKECDLTFVCMGPGWTKLPWDDQGWKYIKAWPEIRKNIQRARFPQAFMVSLQGKVTSLGRIKNL